MIKKITILGSTGTIGKNTLEVIRHNPDLFQVYALSANTNIEELEKQVLEFMPEVVVLSEEKSFEKAKKIFSGKLKVLYGKEGLEAIASEDCVDFVMAGIVGAAGIYPFVAALETSKMIGLANKEVLVMAGEYITSTYPKFKELVIPVDSEHSAIFQCLQDRRNDEIESLILTASGGPFRERSSLDNVTIAEALKHPNWKMGEKISIDSATMMNKGFELIEAFWMFDVPVDKIKVLIHPQSIIHSMVQFYDGSILAHLGIADMQIPIQFALSYPFRIKNNLPRLNFADLKKLTFEEPDVKKFPCLQLAFDSLTKGGVFSTILNAANEVSVNSFLSGLIEFTDICKCNKYVLDQFEACDNLNLEEILRYDQLSRKEAQRWISSL